MELKEHIHTDIDGVGLYVQIEAYPDSADYEPADVADMAYAVNRVKDHVEGLDEPELPSDIVDEADSLAEELADSIVDGDDEELPEFDGYQMEEHVGTAAGFDVYRDEDGDAWIAGVPLEEPTLLFGASASALSDLVGEAYE